jgi:uncharacterized membrane protein YbhN (UPF0104 family)
MINQKIDMEKTWYKKTRAIFKTERVRKLLMGVIVIGCLLFLGHRLISNWQEIKFVISDLNFKYLGISFLVLIASFLLRPVGFYLFLKNSTSKLSYLETFRAMFFTQLTKYLPGGVWVYPSRMVILKQMGVDVGFSSMGLIFESITLVLASLLLGSAFFNPEWVPAAGFRKIQIIVFITSSILGIILIIFPELIQKYLPVLAARATFLNEIQQFTIRKRLVAFLWSVIGFVLMWGLAGISFYYLIIALDENLMISFLVSISVFSLSWLGGFISLFNPGGVGIRETIIVVLLSVILVEPIPLIVAILSRIMWTLLELIFFVLSWLLGSVT